MSDCEALVTALGFNWGCGGTALTEVTVMCVHEHLTVTKLCGRHMARAIEDGLACGSCHAAGAFDCKARLIDSKPLGFADETVTRALTDGPE